MYSIDDKYFKDISEIAKHYFYRCFNLRRDSRQSKSDNIFPVADAKELQDSRVLEAYNVSYKLPIVVLIGGVGRSGKSSFISFCKEFLEGVHEESTIDCCKDVVGYMEKLEFSSYMETLELPSDLEDVSCESKLGDYTRNKSDEYRTLLSELKAAWCKVDDGPNTIVCNRVKSLMLETPGTSDTSVIFINVREPDQISHLKYRLESELKCVVITLIVKRENEVDFSNVSDRITMNYNYDIAIHNFGDLEDLKKSANDFCLAIAYTSNFIRQDVLLI